MILSLNVDDRFASCTIANIANGVGVSFTRHGRRPRKPISCNFSSILRR
jgi:hypothetical protein